MKTALRTALVAGAVFGCMLWADGALGATVHAAEAKQVTINVNGEALQFTDIIPILDEDENLYVPLRGFADQMGYTINWTTVDEDIVEIEFSNGDKTIRFRTDSPKAEIDGQTVDMGSEPWAYKNNTYLPLRFLMEQYNLEFTWNPQYLKTIPSIERHAPEVPKAAEPKTGALTDRILNTAHSYVGVPYVWGGTSPSGFDCSGYVNYVYSKHGISLPRTSRDMYRATGTSVSNPQPGDLLFFADGGKSITHVGIYIGNNQYLNASSGNAHRVIVSSLSSSWSSRTYVGAKRVL
ncbi:NlpC/P60 family protein [Paenibacillus sp. MER TA 81-3]|uniref:C40 family peptidase n=1 Tax=Paenibacillus sp. MER TA 81-3 TaxID=2939573 RepID=UPI00203E3D0B|nr:NlpC/P60 family protein [Paenibacillus sp. MER TA 81-3]MCM3338615.1 NlpC/P60 family protein [Paenibacillus sp. MER TA 81-3]